MANWNHFYLVRISFLGFRYHGWQKQGKLKSVQGMMDKTFEFIFQHTDFKTIGCGRTDAKVSADDFVLELFCNEDLVSSELLDLLNQNLPSDIRAISVEPTDASFNLIQHSKTKEYHYYFSFGEKSHPFNAPLIRDFGKDLDIPLMQKGALIFEGIHNFKRYASKPSPNTIFEREVLSSKIESNQRFDASTTPKNTFVFKIKAKGFLRYQVRLMMGTLVDLGRHEITLEELQNTLEDWDKIQVKHIAPSSGLLLHKVEL